MALSDFTLHGGKHLCDLHIFKFITVLWQHQKQHTGLDWSFRPAPDGSILQHISVFVQQRSVKLHIPVWTGPGCHSRSAAVTLLGPMWPSWYLQLGFSIRHILASLCFHTAAFHSFHSSAGTIYTRSRLPPSCPVCCLSTDFAPVV